jgi:hypothetical protein
VRGDRLQSPDESLESGDVEGAEELFAADDPDEERRTETIRRPRAESNCRPTV